MTITREFPVPTLHWMIQQALLDLKQARNVDDTNMMMRAEHRMNALLDQLAHRILTGNHQGGTTSTAA
ncbi:MAG TPA: hypothetical protein VFG87_04285 [Amycolatopsis sp.]|nr:hypothetical protein [Amycolatopsis sp.]